MRGSLAKKIRSAVRTTDAENSKAVNDRKEYRKAKALYKRMRRGF